MWGNGGEQLGTRTHCVACARWRKKLEPTCFSGVKRAMGYGHGTRPRGKRWMISGSGDISWKGKVRGWSFGTGWRISLSPWIEPWLGWGSMSGYGNML